MENMSHWASKGSSKINTGKVSSHKLGIKPFEMFDVIFLDFKIIGRSSRETAHNRNKWKSTQYDNTTTTGISVKLGVSKQQRIGKRASNAKLLVFVKRKVVQIELTKKMYSSNPSVSNIPLIRNPEIKYLWYIYFFKTLERTKKINTSRLSFVSSTEGSNSTSAVQMSGGSAAVAEIEIKRSDVIKIARVPH